MTDELIDTVLEYVATLPDPQCEVFFGQLGGAQARVSNDATAYQGREAEFLMNVHGRWSDRAQDETCIQWCRALFDATAPFATGEVYVNFMTEEESGRIESAYGSSYARLVELKNRYDPGNMFRMNQNIRPTDRLARLRTQPASGAGDPSGEKSRYSGRSHARICGIVAPAPMLHGIWPCGIEDPSFLRRV